MRFSLYLILLFSINCFSQTKDYNVKRISNQTEILDVPYSSNFAIHNTADSSTNLAKFKMAYDSVNIYIEFIVQDSLIESHQTKRDSKIFNTDDCVEIFLDFDGDGKNYLEFGANPNGVFYDYHIICPKPVCGKWDSNPDFNLNSASVKTTISRDSLVKYNIILKIAELQSLPSSGFTMPQKGTIWKANFFNINPSQKAYNSWSPTKSFGFHQPEFFGRLIFED